MGFTRTSSFIATITMEEKEIADTVFNIQAFNPLTKKSCTWHLPGFCKGAKTALTNFMHETTSADKKKVVQNLMKSIERLSMSFRSWLWLLHFCCSGNVTGGLQRDEVAYILPLSVHRVLEAESRQTQSSFKHALVQIIDWCCSESNKRK